MRPMFKNVHACQAGPGDHERSVGFTGIRVPVKNLFDLEGSSSLEKFLEDFPLVSGERAVAVLKAAQERLAADAPAA